LGLLKHVIEQQGFAVKDHLDDEEPYIYVKNPNKSSFDGIRVYKVLANIGFRVQKEESTHPYGKSYALDVEEMYEDLLEDDKKDSKAAENVMKMIGEELKRFFDRSAEAEKEIRSSEFDQDGDPLDKVVIKSSGTDYSNNISK
jgi:hypothetical protein